MNAKKNIKVIGIDPAPGKPSTYFDNITGKTEQLEFPDLKKRLTELQNQEGKILICWDSPITIPLDNDNISLTDRTIEKFLRDKTKNKNGVSVLPYSSCPHWTISRHMIGLPIMGDYEKNEIPFKIVTTSEKIEHSIVEVHPAVAIYFWLVKDFKQYKGSKPKELRKKENWADIKRKNAIANWEKLKEIKCIKNISDLAKVEITTDDELDAVVAYLLGILWIEKKECVRMLGNEKTGMMLIPYVKILFENFEEWQTKNVNKNNINKISNPNMDKILNKD
jgi:hypothetical protein